MDLSSLPARAFWTAASARRPPTRLHGGLKKGLPRNAPELFNFVFPAVGNLGKREGAGVADREAVAKGLTSLAKWRKVTAKASVLAVRELIVARRSPAERKQRRRHAGAQQTA